MAGSNVDFDNPKDEIIPQFLEECSFAGHYYAVPYMRSTEALYVNKTYVEKLGYELPDVLTWDFIWEVSETAGRKRCRRHIYSERTEGDDTFYLQVHRQYDDSDVKAA